jgi:hypothetical protein
MQNPSSRGDGAGARKVNQSSLDRHSEPKPSQFQEVGARHRNGASAELLAVFEQEFDSVFAEFEARHSRPEILPAALKIIRARRNQKSIRARFYRGVRRSIAQIILDAITVANRAERGRS